MAKNESTGINDESTLLEQLSQLMDEEGFSQIEVLSIGPKKNGNASPFYVGQLIGRGADIVRDDVKSGEERRQPTYVFHPYTSKGLNRRVTNIIPASYQINAACERILDNMKEQDAHAIVGIIFIDKLSLGPKNVNQYKIGEKYFPRSSGITMRGQVLLPAIIEAKAITDGKTS